MNKRKISLFLLVALLLVGMMIVFLAILLKNKPLMYTGLAILISSACIIAGMLLFILKKWLEEKAE